MKHISEFITRDPNPEEKVIIDRVAEIALTWMAGDLTLAEAKAMCEAYERFQAVRFLPRSSKEKLAVMAMVEHITIDDPMRYGPKFRIVDYGTEPIPQKPVNVMSPDSKQPPLWIPYDQLARDGWKQVTNWDGKRVWVSPLFWMNGEPRYPPFHLQPGEERRKEEAAMNADYYAYRKKKGGKSNV